MSPRLHLCPYPGFGTLTNGGRCDVHALPARGHAHARAAKQTLAEETTCWLCGLPGTPEDPLVAGHVLARALGGADSRENYHAVHQSHNQRSGTRGLEEISSDSIAPDDSRLTESLPDSRSRRRCR